MYDCDLFFICVRYFINILLHSYYCFKWIEFSAKGNCSPIYIFQISHKYIFSTYCTKKMSTIILFQTWQLYKQRIKYRMIKKNCHENVFIIFKYLVLFCMHLDNTLTFEFQMRHTYVSLFHSSNRISAHSLWCTLSNIVITPQWFTDSEHSAWMILAKNMTIKNKYLFFHM